MIRINQIKLPIDYKEGDLKNKISQQLKISTADIVEVFIQKKSLDARKANQLFFVFVVDIQVKNETLILKRNPQLEKSNPFVYEYPVTTKEPCQPIVVGFGPAGIFAAYILAKCGQNPIVLERGEDVDNRTVTVEEFWKTGNLNTESNVQFGEGGAGTFSDGKLTARSKDIRSKKVLEVLVAHGAPEEILYSNKPHVGTDVLKGVVKNIRNAIIDMGGKVHFNTHVEKLIIENQTAKGVATSKGEFYSDHIILATGHSSRDTYENLYHQNVKMEQKPFAMGVRIEHLQSTIDLNQYGSLEARKHLGASDYKLTHTTSNGRSVYSFCVCPGGMVVASASELGGLVVNGMSEHARNQKNINSALLVQINTSDFGSDNPLAGIDFQRQYERKAFNLTNDYQAPIQTVGSFLYDEINQLGSIKPSYKPGVVFSELKDCLPEYVVKSLQEGLISFGKKIKGFAAADVILTGIETRSSSPVRILRNSECLESITIYGLYPIGEGAGYAGGIVSSAIDGIRIAEIIINK